MAGNRGKSKLLKPPVIWPCVRIQQDSRQATNHCAMCENTTRLQATGGKLNYWSHQLFGHAWKYNKISGKRPVSLKCLKIQQDCRQWGKHLDDWRRQIFCLRLQQDCRQRGKISVIEATNELAMFENTTRLQATGGNVNYWRHQLCDLVSIWLQGNREKF